MYFIIGKITAILFLVFSISLLFIPKGRKVLSVVFEDTILGEIVDRDSDFYKYNSSLEISLIITVTAILYIIFCIIASFTIILIYPSIYLLLVVYIIVNKNKQKQ